MQILDRILIVTECVEDCRSRKQKAVIVKIDIEKSTTKSIGISYTRLWQEMFRLQMQSRVFERLSTTRVLIILNGSHKGFFLTTRGLRQGDPLSFLFRVASNSQSQV